MTSSVGTISDLGLFFGNIVQFINNKNGITYSNIGNLLLNNQTWLGNNRGTYEKLTDSFGLVQKVSGFSTVGSGATGFDVSSNPRVSDGVLLSTVFSGAGNYVEKYTTGSYDDYNFTNDWTVNCPGIPVRNDDTATGNLYYKSSSVVYLGPYSIKLPDTTSSIRNFRTSGPSSNKLVYGGKRARSLNIFGAISFTAIARMRMTYSLHKNGVLIRGTEVVYDISDTNGRQGLSIHGIVMVNPTDYIEVYVELNTDSYPNEFLVTS